MTWSTKPSSTTVKRLDVGEQLLLRGRLQRAEQHLGVGERRLHALGIGGIEASHHPFERARVDLEGRHVLRDQPLEPGADVGPGEHGVMGDLVQADPEAEVVGRQAPLVGEHVEVGRHDEQLVGRRSGDRQVVLAEGAPAEVAEHGPRLQPEQHGTDHPPEVAEQLVGGGVVVRVGLTVADGTARRRAAPLSPAALSDTASRSNSGLWASRLRIAHSPRVTGATLRTRPVTEVARPVRSEMWRSATRTSSSSFIRSSGSTLASASPSVARKSAICRATSQFTGPCWANMRPRSPKSLSKGLKPPGGPGVLTRAS